MISKALVIVILVLTVFLIAVVAASIGRNSPHDCDFNDFVGACAQGDSR